MDEVTMMPSARFRYMCNSPVSGLFLECDGLLPPQLHRLIHASAHPETLLHNSMTLKLPHFDLPDGISKKIAGDPSAAALSHLKYPFRSNWMISSALTSATLQSATASVLNSVSGVRYFSQSSLSSSASSGSLSSLSR